jgi:DNA-binding transcriptional LysR family regulator
VGVRLVNRTARSVSLTEFGVRYSEFARRVLDEIEEEDRAIAQLRKRPEGRLSVISPKWIGTLDLGDAIAAFSVAHPKIVTRFELGGMSDRTYDFLDSGFDVAFHTRELRDSRVRQEKVASLPFVLCASESYIKSYGQLTNPDDLPDHDCLVHTNDLVWNIGPADSATPHKIRRIAFVSNSYLTLQKAAVHGRGIALLPLRAVHEHLANGTLRVLLPELSVPDRPLYAIYAPGQRTPEKVKVFLKFMTTWFRRNPMPAIDRRSASPSPAQLP